MALTNLAVFGGAFFTPILVGKITHTIGWTWTFYLEAIFFGACFPCVVFFVPETAFRRSAHLNTDMAASDDVAMHKIDINTHELEHEPDSFPRNYLPGNSTGHRLDSSVENTSSPQGTMPGGTVESNSTPLSGRTERFVDSPPPTKRSFAQSLRPFNGRYTDEGFIQLLVRPFMLFAHPAILWAMFIQGAMIGWTVFIGIILAAIFLGPPLFWDEVETGYAYTGAFIGAVVGFVIAGGLADWSARFMTRRNNGVYEPEFRILLVIPQLIFGCAGLYGFGVTSSHLTHYDFHWPIIFFGFEVMGMVIGAVASALYIVDAHRTISSSLFETSLTLQQARSLLKRLLVF
jgi:MFS family permease